MSRRKKDAPIDLAHSHELTVGLIEALRCPEGKQQAFLRDKTTRGLQVRVTAGGAKSYVFETRVSGKTMRRTIGTVGAWSIEAARVEANKLRVLTDSRLDPRQLDRDEAERKATARTQAEEAAAARAREEAARAVTAKGAWSRYVAEGGPKRRDSWKPRYVADMMRMTAAGGESKLRGKGVTLPGHLTPLLDLRLVDIDQDRLSIWFATECKRSKHQATRALMMFRGFLRWCTTQPDLRGLVHVDAGRAPGIVDSLPATTRRTDALEASQVAGWWAGVTQLSNPVVSTYLRALILTGARREEMAAARWNDVDFRWRKLTIADKVGNTRTIPLTPYMAWMFSALPRARLVDGQLSPFVFPGAGKAGRLMDPRSSHEKALKTAGVERLTLHGRSAALVLAPGGSCRRAGRRHRPNHGPQAQRNGRGVPAPQR
jgi:integrase